MVWHSRLETVWQKSKGLRAAFSRGKADKSEGIPCSMHAGVIQRAHLVTRLLKKNMTLWLNISLSLRMQVAARVNGNSNVGSLPCIRYASHSLHSLNSLPAIIGLNAWLNRISNNQFKWFQRNRDLVFSVNFRFIGCFERLQN